MGWNFRRSIRIAPGVRLNVGKRSASVSLGGKGLRYTTGTRGSRITAGLPGTGLSYTHQLGKRPPRSAPPAQAAHAGLAEARRALDRTVAGLLLAVLAALLVAIAVMLAR